MSTLAERLLARTAREGDCLVWQGHPCTGNYASMRTVKVDGKWFWGRVHRVAYELWVGPIPPGYDVDHLCHNDSDCKGGDICRHRLCVEPSHLEAVLPKINRNRSPNSNAAKTACPKGHSYNDQNTGLTGGSRRCRTCRAERARDAYAAAKAQHRKAA